MPRISEIAASVGLLLLIGVISVDGLVKEGDYQNSLYQQNLESNSATGATASFPFLMPNVSPQTPDLYLCTPIKVDPTTTYYIVGFNPNATMNTAHHMLLYGCGEPGTSKTTWNCGEMNRASQEESASPCGPHSNSQIVYAWARDAQKLNLPEGVGFKVGKNSPIKYLVLQVHYAHIDKFKDGSTDDSGVFLDYTEEPRKKLAGTLLLGTDGQIPAMKTEHLETACEVNEQKVLHPFAYRVHTHGLGKVVSGYRVRTNSDGEQEWLQLGKRDPLTPQMFYNTSNTDPIIEGDKIAVRCTMQSTRHRTTKIGPTNEDEMCNFYLMYYVDHGETLNMKFCFSQGAPYYFWSNPDSGLHNIPHIEASTL
uniref:Peptidylglycine alpha-hydroxylating monooxygenase n=2 Tax=Drosophila melanogaster TaxID=7227 RepID=PHM_DROME|nr:Peptidylglycine-alpha-hydroxylating monooxygenase, isoform A [Drosophila melanogaster]NP_726394.1 Peptidylglycine-alpha-hydroxylating monooxygenase, isoform B [Drosophila melanogaster]O01404.2 RecName: Full=Peptidylglycine alpha-hydroxylating monooxygenase; Short=dPHM; Flags: Precursor [Drosophila melanogaster]ACL90680.1 Phm-PA [synthetic construct]AAB61676.1 peptidylglycine alpha-hydroxylating monooxygenase [Drosophila melanogaster]AAF47127.1 Peptidylglycine-alpha-hydroxylating monooxygena|eukprot:NP_477225.1 Peptidylglycine-alpha-hydroxylating monooxygenase, isoform A [Drosophila melanogaster]